MGKDTDFLAVSTFAAQMFFEKVWQESPSISPHRFGVQLTSNPLGIFAAEKFLVFLLLEIRNFGIFAHNLWPAEDSRILFRLASTEVFGKLLTLKPIYYGT
ncbi:MAG: hypothetical protein IKB97_08700 [Bacteroidaceae bacterium]|nr:hypothetical protein [Bacteroidaceae bacterium]